MEVSAHVKTGRTITVLADNTAHELGLLGEHGLSLWVETPETCVLFDTGQGPALPHNAARLGIDLAGADSIVLSHGHHDHTGGLLGALIKAPDARLVLHPSSTVTRFSCRDGKAREIGMPAHVREAVNRRRASCLWTQGPTEIAPGMFVTGSVPRRTGFEDTGGPFFLDADGTLPDPIEDDQAMWIETADGLVVLLGCAHSGVVNTLDYIHCLTKGRPIRAVLGGMHLGSASDERVMRTIASLTQRHITDVRPCHCTGANATAQLTAAFGGRCHPGSVGMTMAL